MPPCFRDVILFCISNKFGHNLAWLLIVYWQFCQVFYKIYVYKEFCKWYLRLYNGTIWSLIALFWKKKKKTIKRKIIIPFSSLSGTVLTSGLSTSGVPLYKIIWEQWLAWARRQRDRKEQTDYREMNKNNHIVLDYPLTA